MSNTRNIGGHGLGCSLLLVAMALGTSCMAQEIEGDSPRVLPAGPVGVETETKTVVEVCDWCEWVEYATPVYDYEPIDDVEPIGEEEGGLSESDTSPTDTDGGTAGDTDGGTDGGTGGSNGLCFGVCPPKDVGGEMVIGECTEYAPGDCRCVYEIPKEELTIKVLVTGFADFDELGDPYEVDSNPSGRLLTGDATSDFRTDTLDGPLVDWLEANVDSSECGVDIEFDFKVLPVLWETAKDNIDYCEYDFVISMGVGLAKPGTIDLEQDAGNGRSGTDVNGNSPPSPTIDPDRPADATIQGHGSVRDRVSDQDGQTHGGYTVDVKDARDSNCYICNETHCTGLLTLEDQQEACESDCALDGVFFIHLPNVPADDGLAAGVGGLIEDLVQPF